MTRRMSVEELEDILGKLDDKTLEKIFSKDIRIGGYNKGMFNVVIGNLVICKVDLRSGEVTIYEKSKSFSVSREINMEYIPQLNSISTLTDDLWKAAEPEAPEEEEVNDEGIMQLADLFEEEEDG